MQKCTHCSRKNTCERQLFSFEPTRTNFLLKLPQIVKFLKMRAKRAKICNFYVKFDTKVVKRGSLGLD